MTVCQRNTTYLRFADQKVSGAQAVTWQIVAKKNNELEYLLLILSMSYFERRATEARLKVRARKYRNLSTRLVRIGSRYRDL
jgi:hypothetical protein